MTFKLILIDSFELIAWAIGFGKNLENLLRIIEELNKFSHEICLKYCEFKLHWYFICKFN